MTLHDHHYSVPECHHKLSSITDLGSTQGNECQIGTCQNLFQEHVPLFFATVMAQV